MKRSSNEVGEFLNSPLSRYLSDPHDFSCVFLETDSVTKFWKATLDMKVGKYTVTIQHGDVGTDGMTETVEFESQRQAVMSMQEFRNAKLDENYLTFSSLEVERKSKKARIAKKSINFPQLTGTCVFARYGTSSASWIPLLQQFLETYEYLGDSLHLDFSSADDKDWKFYNSIEDEGDKAMKKEHAALVKKDAFAKQLSKVKRGQLIRLANGNEAINYKFFELEIDGTTFYLLTVSMCVNDPMGHYNVLYTKQKKEIFRLEICDNDDRTVAGGTWKTAAMKKKYQPILNRIETFIACDLLCVDEDFGFDWEGGTCVSPN
jgi:predicted DNA-binding WGR domain protein